ncbi:MAG: transposase domain-containing protein [Clostridiales bacterium]|nr:transposase domain-containing protein [Clostridiales bacterium]
MKHLLEQLPYRMDSSGKILPSDIDELLPWSTNLPNKCCIQSRR